MNLTQRRENDGDWNWLKGDQTPTLLFVSLVCFVVWNPTYLLFLAYSA